MVLHIARFVRYANVFASSAGAVAKTQQRFLGVGRDERAVFGQDVAAAKAAALRQHRTVLSQ
jgi:hypothetical protein